MQVKPDGWERCWSFLLRCLQLCEWTGVSKRPAVEFPLLLEIHSGWGASISIALEICSPETGEQFLNVYYRKGSEEYSWNYWCVCDDDARGRSWAALLPKVSWITVTSGKCGPENVWKQWSTQIFTVLHWRDVLAKKSQTPTVVRAKTCSPLGKLFICPAMLQTRSNSCFPLAATGTFSTVYLILRRTFNHTQKIKGWPIKSETSVLM